MQQSSMSERRSVTETNQQNGKKWFLFFNIQQIVHSDQTTNANLKMLICNVPYKL